MKINIKELPSKDNISEDLEKDVLSHIANAVYTGYKADLDSQQEWLADVQKVEELSTLASKKKNYPLPNSANIKFPIVTKACYEFSSRTYPEIVKDGQIVKTNVIGKDFTGEKEAKARRVAEYMNWQLYWDNDDWELELDRLLNRLALIGFICKKTYFDPIRKIVKSELCEPCDLVINADVKSLEDAVRITHVIKVRLNDLIEGSRTGVYCEEVVNKLIEQQTEDELNPIIELLEQHTYYDLDEDDYREPYIVTTTKENPEVLRIVARFESKNVETDGNTIVRIQPNQHFTDYHFLVSPKGKFQSVGFGILLLHLNETINTILNQLVDAGSLNNMQGGYIDARLKNIASGDQRFNQGQWNYTKVMGGLTLKEGILPLDYKEPSNVLYQLLGLLVDAARDLSSSNDLMTGNSSPENSKTGATQALIAEGVKIHNSINKRVYRSLGNEFYRIFKMDSKYLDENQARKVLDDDISKEDFDDTHVDVIPVADPNLASQQKQAMEIQKLMAIVSMPGIDPLKVTERILKKVIEDHPEELLLDQNKPQPPNPEVVKIQADIQDMAEKNKLKAHELEQEDKRLDLEMYKTQCECLKLKADAMKSIAEAQGQTNNGQFEAYQQELEILSQRMQQSHDETQMMHDYTSQQADQQHQMQMQREQQAHEQMQQQSEQQHEQEIQSQQQAQEGQTGEQSG